MKARLALVGAIIWLLLANLAVAQFGGGIGGAGFSSPAPPAAAAGTTWNPANKTANTDLSNGNLTAAHANDGVATGASAWSIAGHSSGKYFWKLTVLTPTPMGSVSFFPGFSTDGNDGRGVFNADSVAYADTGRLLQNNVDLVGGLETYAVGDIISFALDLTGNKVWVKKNSGLWNNDGSADPATGTNGVTFSALSADAHASEWVASNTSDGYTADFSGSGAPSGFGAW